MTGRHVQQKKGCVRGTELNLSKFVTTRILQFQMVKMLLNLQESTESAQVKESVCGCSCFLNPKECDHLCHAQEIRAVQFASPSGLPAGPSLLRIMKSGLQLLPQTRTQLERLVLVKLLRLTLLQLSLWRVKPSKSYCSLTPQLPPDQLSLLSAQCPTQGWFLMGRPLPPRSLIPLKPVMWAMCLRSCPSLPVDAIAPSTDPVL